MKYTGELLRKIRNFKDVKQTVVAERLSITQAAYSKLEQRPLIKEERWHKVMQALCVDEAEWKSLLKLTPATSLN